MKKMIVVFCMVLVTGCASMTPVATVATVNYGQLSEETVRQNEREARERDATRPEREREAREASRQASFEAFAQGVRDYQEQVNRNEAAQDARDARDVVRRAARDAREARYPRSTTCQSRWNGNVWQTVCD